MSIQHTVYSYEYFTVVFKYLGEPRSTVKLTMPKMAFLTSTFMYSKATKISVSDAMCRSTYFDCLIPGGGHQAVVVGSFDPVTCLYGGIVRCYLQVRII